MEKNIEPQLKAVGKYLSTRVDEPKFKIPEYQRAYSWGIEQCDKLIQSIEDFIGSGGRDPYFFGTIIIDCSNYNERSLIDGQQRTTTFFLLLKAILLRINAVLPATVGEASEPLKAGLEARRNALLKILYYVDDEGIPELIRKPDSIKSIDVPVVNKSNNETHANDFIEILKALSFEDAETHVHHTPRKQRDNRYTQFFRNFKFFYGKMKEKSASEINVFAKKLLDECQVIEIRSWNVEQAIVMFNSLNSTGLPLTDSDILSAQLYAKASGSKEYEKKWREFYDIADRLNTKGIANVQDLFAQYMYITRAKSGISDLSLTGVRKYFMDGTMLNDPFCFVDNLIALANKWELVADNNLVKLLLKFNFNARFFAAAYMFSHGTDDIKTAFESLLKLFVILEIVDFGYSSSKFKQFLFLENIKISNPLISKEEIMLDFKSHINANWQRENIKSLILSYDGTLLVLLNEYVYCETHHRDFFFNDKYNIEHIMPVSGRNKPSYKMDAGIESEEEFNDIVNLLGNKIMLEEYINKSIGNEWFRTKKITSVSDKTGYKNSSYAIAQALVKYPNDFWTKEDIKTATEKAAQRIISFLFD